MSRFIAGDIGGTKTRLAIVEVAGTQVNVERESTYSSRDFATFEVLLAAFLAGMQAPSYAAFGIAGPVLMCNIGARCYIGVRNFQVCSAVQNIQSVTNQRGMELAWRLLDNM